MNILLSIEAQSIQLASSELGQTITAIMDREGILSLMEQLSLNLGKDEAISMFLGPEEELEEGLEDQPGNIVSNVNFPVLGEAFEQNP